MNSFKKVLSLLLALAMVLSLAACGGASAPAETPADAPAAAPSEAPSASDVVYADTIVYGATAFTTGDFMPLGGLLNADGFFHQIVYPHLLQATPDGEWESYLAKSYEVSADGMVYTFHLHENAVWDDGEPVTAHDVAFTLNVLADASNDGGESGKLLCIKGVQAFRDGTADSVEGIKVIDDHTLELTFETISYPGISYCLLHSILPEHIWGGKMYPDLSNIESMTADQVVGAGPYRMAEYVPGEYVTLEANPHFYLGEPITKTLIVKAVNADAISVELTSGNIDIVNVNELATDEIAMLEAQGYIQHTFYDNLVEALSYTYMNTGLQRAILHAIDREGIVAGLLEGRGTKVDLPMSPASWAYPDDFVGAPFDPEMAKSILAESGWVDVDGDGFVEDPEGNPFVFDIACTTGKEAREKAAVVVAQNLKDVGINTNVRVAAMMAFYEDFGTDRLDCMMLSYNPEGTDPDFSAMLPAYGYPEEVYGLMNQAAATNDPEIRKDLYAQVAQIQADTACVISMYTEDYSYIYAPNIVNFAPGTYNFVYNIHQWAMTQ